MKRKLLSFLILAFYTHAYSQNSEEFIPSDAHSPNAAELSSYGFMPVSLYTGLTTTNNWFNVILPKAKFL